MKNLIIYASLSLVPIVAALAAWDYLYHPTVTFNNQFTETEIEKLQNELSERGVTLLFEKLKFNSIGEISEIQGSVKYYTHSSGTFETDDFTSINGGLFYMDLSFQ